MKTLFNKPLSLFISVWLLLSLSNNCVRADGVTYIYGDAPTYRGKIILLVDKTMAVDADVSPKIQRLIEDLIGDGWRVVRHDVDRGAVLAVPEYDSTINAAETAWAAQNAIQVRQVKAIIKADYDAAPNEVKAVFLLGHVAIPYSGNDSQIVGNHSDWQGAHASDTFYGETLAGYGPGGWTDYIVDNSSLSLTSENHELVNVPGDGKFDQGLPGYLDPYEGPNVLPPLALGVGRVDLYHMPDMDVNEAKLIARYLDKDHDFRNGNPSMYPIARRTFETIEPGGGQPIVQNTTASLPFLVNGVNFAGPYPSPGNPADDSFFPYVSEADQDYLFGGCFGFGTATGQDGIVSTFPYGATSPTAGHDGHNYLDIDSRIVFMVESSSLKGDWDEVDNFLRAPLANPYDPANGRFGFGLTCTWGGFGGLVNGPANIVKIAQGATIGQAEVAGYVGNVNFGLMGDPSLRAYTVLPASGLTISLSGTALTLNWTASADTAVSGYNIYYSPTLNGPWTLANSSPVTATTYSPTRPSSSSAPDNFYMVRAVKTETTSTMFYGTLTYVNMSEGITGKIPGRLASFLAINSSPASLAVVPYPVVPGSTQNTPLYAAFAVEAEGSDSVGNGQVSYQWYKNGIPMSDATDPRIQGASSSCLLISGVQSGDVGSYYVVVGNTAASGYPGLKQQSVTSSTATLAIKQPPVAVADTYSILRNTPTDFHVLNNDTDPNSGTTLSVLSVSPPSDATAGTLHVSSDGTYVQFTPSIAYTGEFTFTYIISDGVGSAQATGTVTVSDHSDAVVTITSVSDQTIGENASTSVDFTLSDNYSPIADLVITATSSDQSLVPNYNLIPSLNGSDLTLRIQPVMHTSGSATITVTVTDLDGKTTSTTFNVTVPLSTVPNLFPVGLASSSSGNVFNLNVNAPSGLVVQLFQSSDLLNWTSLGAVTVGSGNTVAFADSTIGASTHMFYKAQSANGASQNVTGFITTTLAGGGSTFIANQLNNPYGNGVGSVLQNMTDSSELYKWNNTTHTYDQALIYSADTSDPMYPPGWYGSDFETVIINGVTLSPGEGANFVNASSSPLVVTMVGDVTPPGQQSLTIATGSGYSLVSSVVPRPGSVASLGVPIANGDSIQEFLGGVGTVYSMSGPANVTAWSPSAPPAINLAQPFFVHDGNGLNRTWDPAPSLVDGHFTGTSGADFQFTISGGNSAYVEVRASQDLENWTSLGYVTLSGGTYTFTDSGAASLPNRYYNVHEGNVAGVNTLGFINVTVPAASSSHAGFALIANQLNNVFGNSLAVLFPSMPDGAYIQTLNSSGTAITVSTFSASANAWSSPGVTLSPGQGFFFGNPSSSPLQLTFVGNVPAAPQAVTVPAGDSYLSSLLPVSAGLDVLGFPAEEFDLVYTWNLAAQTYNQASIYACDPCGWYDSGFIDFVPPITQPGQAFTLVSSDTSARVWEQPVISGGVFANNDFQFTITGQPGASVLVKASSDLSSWTTLSTVTLGGDGTYAYVDSGAKSQSYRFYVVDQGAASSANIYGFIQESVPAGDYDLIADQLVNPAGNSVGALLPSVPNGTIIQKMNSAGAVTTVATFSTSVNAWDHPEVTLNPGEGAFIRNSTSALSLVFVGNVLTGTASLSLPADYHQYAILSSVLPVADVAGFPGVDFDYASVWNKSGQTYDQAIYYDLSDGLGWIDANGDPLTVTPGVGHAFVLYGQSTSARSWSQYLSPVQ